MSYKTQLYAFGSNGESQLGLGYASDKHPTPTIVSGVPADIKYIRGGGNHTLLLTHSGSVYGCGSNSSHQFAYHYPSKERNKQVDALQSNLGYSGRLLKLLEFEKIKSISGDAQAQKEVLMCGASWDSSVYIVDWSSENIGDKTGATVYGVGPGDFSGRPDGTFKRDGMTYSTVYKDRPIIEFKRSLSPAVVDFAVGTHHYAAVCNDGTVKAWGRWKRGQLGARSLITTHAFPNPMHVTEVTFKAERAVCGQHFTYVVGSKESGEHLVLGDDKHGVRAKMPEHVKGWKDIGATWNAVFVLFEDGSLTAWGKETLWELIPSKLPKIEKLAVGSDHILAVTEAGKVIAWGWATHGNCGNIERLAEEGKLKIGYVTGTWNEVNLGVDVGEVVGIGAGCSTSFVWTRKSVSQ